MSDFEESRVERIVAGGAGLIRREGPVCFVRGVLPGELIWYRLLGRRRGVLTGELLKVLEPSPDRVTPPCDYYEECGGCELQEIAYQGQLRIKGEILREQLTRIGGLDGVAVRETRGGASYGYRTRVRMHRSREGRFGFRRRRSREIVPVERCIVASEAINREIAALQTAAPRAKEITLAEHDGGVARSDRPGPVTATILGRPVRFSGAGFFQSNIALFSRLLTELLSAAAPPPEYLLYDLYAGTGAIAAVVAGALAEDPSAAPGSAPTAPGGPSPAGSAAAGTGTTRAQSAPARIHCVEPAAASAHFIPENLPEFPHSVHEEPLERFVRREAPPGASSLAIVDPPRAGLSDEVRSWLLRGRPAQLFYVSCDPSTLARDLGELSSGYDLRWVTPYDFFPQTSHIESLSLLTPREEAG